MLTTYSVVSIFTAGWILGVGVVSGQNYPNKPIRIIASEAGGGADLRTRLIAQKIAGPLGQPVIVDNRGILAGEIAAKALPDGYTLVLNASPLWLRPLMQKTSYDPLRDFSAITWLTSAPNIIVVPPSSRTTSIKDLIALAKARPGELNYASPSTGGSSHLSGELFKSMAGVEIVRINYKGSSPALNALITGEVQLMFANALSVMPQIKSGRLNALAVTSSKPFDLTPGLPTVAAAGLPGYESVEISGALAPAGTPTTVINRLHQEMVRALNSADVREILTSGGAEVVGSSPVQFAAKLKSEIAKWGKVIKDAGIRAE